MPDPTFTQLPREIRDMVWSAIAAVQFQYVTESSPNYYTVPRATERQRQTFVSIDDLPLNVERQPLRLYVHDNGHGLRLCANEFRFLVNSLPMAKVCSEARAHALEFCRKQVDIMDLHYTVDSSNVEGESYKQVLQPTTVMVTIAYQPKDGPRGFRSAEHLVTVIDRVFGSGVEHIIFNAWFQSHNSLERVYWPHAKQTRERRRMDYKFIHDTSRDRNIVSMTPDRAMNVSEELFDEDGAETEFEELSHHLLKFYEILEACRQKRKCPHLRSIELELHTYNWDIVVITHVRALIKEGALEVVWSDFQGGFAHDFFLDEEWGDSDLWKTRD